MWNRRFYSVVIFSRRFGGIFQRSGVFPLVDMLSYTILNKIGYKLAASVGIGVAVAFITNMAAYGKAVKQHKVQRVQFRQEEDTESKTRIA